MRLRIGVFLLFLGFIPPYLYAQTGIISTVAGSAPFVFHEGDAHQAPLGEVTSVAVDASGNVYAADVSNRIVVRITPEGELRIVFNLRPATPAGPGTASIAVDNAGNVYVLESEFNAAPRISKIDSISGQATTIIDGVLNQPNGLAVDANGNLYVAEAGTDLIRRIAPDGTITTVAGNGTCGSSGEGGQATLAALCFPLGVAVDQAGNLYIADWGTSRLLKVTLDGTITRIAGNGERGDTGDAGPPLAAKIEPSGGIAVDTNGTLYFTQSHRIREVSSNGLITTLAGSTEANFAGDGGGRAGARFHSPLGLAVDKDFYVNVYIADTGNWRVRRWSTGAGMFRDTVGTVAGNGAFGISGDGGPATSASLNRPYGLVFDRNGNLYYSDIGSHRVRKIDTRGIITTFAGAGRGFAGDGGPATQALLSSPADLATDDAGNIYIADSDNGRIRRVGTDGIIQTVAQGLTAPTGVGVDSAGNIYVL
jgi:sugar lactone lactonase YvrE